MLEMGGAACKALIQICLESGKLFGIVGVDTHHDPFMDAAVNLGQLVTFILVDDKKISGSNAVESVVNQKLFAAGNRIVQLIAVMDMHIHGFFFFI